MTEDQKLQNRIRLGERIALLRKSKGMTQEQLAEAAGLHRPHICKIEAGKYATTIDVLQAIAEALGMTVDIIEPKLSNLTIITN
jgi:transcriptional regulator with XRE-family HTH domain